MMRIFIIMSQWGLGPRKVDQPVWAILAVRGRDVVVNPAMALEIPKRLKVAEPRVGLKVNVAVNRGQI